MRRPILIVGLYGGAPGLDWRALLDGRTVVARSRLAVEQSAASSVTIEHCYDAEFERHALAGVDAEIARDVARRAASADIAYLVPGPGWTGDATVSALTELATIEIAPSAAQAALPAHVQAIDALLLAQAQARSPFDSGSCPLEATVPSLIFNWHGARVVDLAARRLRAVYGVSELPSADPSGTLIMPAGDPLEHPPSFAALAWITARLRQPDGCPWDREQTHASLLKDFANEVEEYAEAVGAADWEHAAEELGDVLLNILMQAQIAAESGHFRIEDVLAGINAKLVRRHPHVFGGVEASTPADVLAVWNNVKQQEKQTRTPR